MKNHSHENFNRKEKVKLGTEKNFGYVFTGVFFLVAVAPLFFSRPLRFGFLIASICFLAVTLIDPARLKPLNQLWGRLGILLGKIVSPIVLGLLFFSAFLPVGILLKLFKKDVLNLKLLKHEKSYWIKSETGLSSMKDQF